MTSQWCRSTIDVFQVLSILFQNVSSKQMKLFLVSTSFNIVQPTLGVTTSVLWQTICEISMLFPRQFPQESRRGRAYWSPRRRTPSDPWVPVLRLPSLSALSCLVDKDKKGIERLFKVQNLRPFGAFFLYSSMWFVGVLWRLWVAYWFIFDILWSFDHGFGQQQRNNL